MALCCVKWAVAARTCRGVVTHEQVTLGAADGALRGAAAQGLRARPHHLREVAGALAEACVAAQCRVSARGQCVKLQSAPSQHDTPHPNQRRGNNGLSCYGATVSSYADAKHPSACPLNHRRSHRLLQFMRFMA